MKTLEEVKEYFKDAIKVKDHNGDTGFVELEKIKENKGCFIQNLFEDNWIVLYHDKKGYAKIKTTKEKIMYSITKEQILELQNCVTNDKLKYWFPEVFKTKLSSKFTGWVKCEEKINIDWLMYFENGLQKYGFDASKQWAEMNSKVYLNGDEIEATEQEVKTALENEAIKRGFGKIGIVFNSLNNDECISDIEGFDFWNLKKYKYSEDSNKFNISVCESGGVIFRQGIWATIIPTLTKKEAEEKLGVKII